MDRFEEDNGAMPDHLFRSFELAVCFASGVAWIARISAPAVIHNFEGNSSAAAKRSFELHFSMTGVAR